MFILVTILMSSCCIIEYNIMLSFLFITKKLGEPKADSERELKFSTSKDV